MANKPSSSATLNTGHPHAAGLIACLPLIEGAGMPSDRVRTTTFLNSSGGTTMIGNLSWATSGNAQYDPCVRNSANTTGDYLVDTHTAPLNNHAGPWSILMGVRFADPAVYQTYAYLEPVNAAPGSGPALVFNFVTNTLELFSPTSTGTTTVRTGSGMTMDTGWHIIGYTYGGQGGGSGTEYAKWLDGTKTVIDTNAVFTFPSGTDRTYLFTYPGDTGTQMDFGFIYEWNLVADLAAVSADPWAMFAPAGPSATYVVFEG